MIDVKRFMVTLRFLENVTFKDPPEVAFYKIFFQRLKNIVCVNSSSECGTCWNRKTCIYFYLSGEDFTLLEAIPVIIKRPLVSKYNYKEGDILTFKYLFLGQSKLHIDFFSYILKELEVYGLFRDKKNFNILQTKVEVLKGEKRKKELIKGLKVITPITNFKDLFGEEYLKIKELNQRFGFLQEYVELMSVRCIFDLKNYIVKANIFLEGKRIRYTGKLGEIYFEPGVENNGLLEVLKIIGLGRLYALGGGQIEFIT